MKELSAEEKVRSDCIEMCNSLRKYKELSAGLRSGINTEDQYLLTGFERHLFNARRTLIAISINITDREPQQAKGQE